MSVSVSLSTICCTSLPLQSIDGIQCAIGNEKESPVCFLFGTNFYPILETACYVSYIQKTNGTQIYALGSSVNILNFRQLLKSSTLGATFFT
jgi:hypothetical protein